MPKTQSPLLALASEEFSEFSPGELKVLEVATKEELASLGEDVPVLTQVERSDVTLLAIPYPRSVRAAVIRWLCVNKQAAALIGPKGIRIAGAVITECLDLQYVVVPFPLRLIGCAMPDGIDLRFANLRALHLSGSKTAGIEATNVAIQAAVRLDQEFEASGVVNFGGADIGDRFICDSGQFKGTSGKYALSLGRAIVGSDVLFGKGFRADGGVTLANARVGGHLKCDGGTFEVAPNEGPWAHALNAEGAQVGGSVLLRNGFQARGSVRLVSARIGDALACTGGRFSSLNENAAIDADHAVITGSVTMNHGFISEGLVRLAGARIEGQVDFIAAEFSGVGLNGLRAQEVVIRGALFWQTVTHNDNTVLDVNRATIGIIADDRSSWPAQDRLILTGCKYALHTDLEANLRIKWLRLQPEMFFSVEPYIQLARYLRSIGHEADARKVAMAGEDARSRSGRLDYVNRLWNRVLKYASGYGYSPRRVLVWISLLVAVGSIVFRGAYRADLVVPSIHADARDSSSLPHYRPYRGYPAFNGFVYSLDTSLPIIDFGQERNWYPDSDADCIVLDRWQGACGQYLRWYLWFHLGMGWILATLGVAGLTGVIKKD